MREIPCILLCLNTALCTVNVPTEWRGSSLVHPAPCTMPSPKNASLSTTLTVARDPTPEQPYQQYEAHASKFYLNRFSWKSGVIDMVKLTLEPQSLILSYNKR